MGITLVKGSPPEEVAGFVCRLLTEPAVAGRTAGLECEKRMKATEWRGREDRTLVTGCYLAFAALGLMLAALGPALPYLAEGTRVTLKTVSYLFVGQSGGYMLGSYLGGRLYDRFPGARLMGLGLLATIALMALVPAFRLFSALLPAVAALGILQGTVDVGGNVLILRTPARDRGVRMNLLHLAFGVGAFVCPLVLTQAVRWTGGIAWGYRGLAALTFPAALWLLRVRSSPPRRTRAAAGGGTHGWVVALVTMFVFLSIAAEAGFGNWIYTYAVQRGLAGRVGAGYLTSVFWGCFAGGRAVSALLSRSMGARKLLLFSLAGCFAGAAPLLLWPQSQALAWSGTALFGLCAGPMVANSMTLAAEKTTVTGRIAGLFVVGISLGGLVLPWLIGQLFEPVGPQVMPASLLATVAAAGGCFLFLARLRPVRQDGPAG